MGGVTESSSLLAGIHTRGNKTRGLRLTSSNPVNVRRGSVSRAKERALTQRCVIAHEDGDGQYQSEDANGSRYSIERLGLFDMSQHLHEFGCPVAMSLLLRFMLEGSVLMVLMFAMSLPQAHANSVRNKWRNDCRQSSFDSYGSLTNGTQDGDAGLMALCGYLGHGVRANMNLLPTYLLYAMGSCQEYTAGSAPIMIPSPTYSGVPVFVSSDSAQFCTSRGGLFQHWESWLAEVGCPLLLLVFLVRMRQLRRAHSIARDLAIWSASDYSTCLEGVCDGTLDKGLEHRLRAELLKCGFGPADIVQVEVSRECATELSLVDELERLRTRLDEVEARHAAGWPPLLIGGAYEATREQLDAKMARVMTRLAAHAEGEHRVTGDVFLVFRTEEKRNQLLQMYREQREGVNEPFAKAPLLLAAGGGTGEAPEPPDIIWANLEVTPWLRRRRLLFTYSVFAVLIALNAGLVVGLKVAQNMEQVLQAEERLGALGKRGAAVLATGITLGTNVALKLVNRQMTAGEGHQSSVDLESSTFTKLALAYTANSVLTPLAVGAFPYFVCQVQTLCGQQCGGATRCLVCGAVLAVPCWR